ncbi:MAG: glycosyltransferase [Microgenomates group bacterium]
MTSKNSKSPKIAIVHDYLREYGGAERVVESIHEIFPDAPVYVSFIDRDVLGVHADKMKDWDIRETWISRLPFYKKLFSPFRIFAPAAFRALDLSEFDFVISSSNAYYAKAVSVPNGKHICYCHTPPRSLYGYSTMSNWKSNPVTKFVGQIMNHFLRMEDFEMAQKVDVFIANSKETQRRIQKFYRRDSQVIYPPIVIPTDSELKKAQEHTTKHDYYLSVGRLTQSKHVDLSIKVCTALQRNLVVIGAGKNSEYLKSLAGPTVQFLGEVSDADLKNWYAGAKALLFPAEDEDFGMVPVEAMGYGVPVIAHASGGPLETVIPGETGVQFSELTEQSLTHAVMSFEKQESKKIFSKKEIRSFAQKFTDEIFKKSMLGVVHSLSR